MKESTVFEELKETAGVNDIGVYTVNLKRYGYCIQSGLCRVRGKYRIVLDRHLHLSEKIDVMIDALQGVSANTETCSEHVKNLLQKKLNSSHVTEPSAGVDETVTGEQLSQDAV